ncbi:MAG TPA: hypothetical protein VET26_06445, partial [Candidatus Sulfotelmatobacter sp.]|nr:hypothetical protein [Candidatus Sulfotelmatobacter sp.]
MVCLTAAQAHAKTSTPSAATVQMLAQGPVQQLPGKASYVSILDFRQVPGAAFGPHAHLAGFVYTLHGVSTISFPAAAARSVGPGEAAFIPAFAAHTHDNVDGRFEAAAIAVGFIVVVILLCAATWLRGGSGRAIVAGLSVLLIAGGALALSGVTANDYLLIVVRADTHHDQPMPRPDGTNIFVSPDISPVPATPWVVTLRA